MIKIKEAIIVEGKYDRQRLSSVVDALIIETTGFDIFKNRETKDFIKKTAIERGIIILTDSDYAGFKIRNHIKSFVPEELIKNAYIPEIKGKEKRKNKPSREGTIGVEGIDNDLLIEELRRCGCAFDSETCKPMGKITKVDLFNDGFIGMENSSELRKMLCAYFELPLKLTTNSLLKAINSFADLEDYRNAVENIAKKRNHE